MRIAYYEDLITELEDWIKAYERSLTKYSFHEKKTLLCSKRAEILRETVQKLKETESD